MNNSWVQIFKAHEYFNDGKISYQHIHDIAWDIRQRLVNVSMPITCVNVAAKIFGVNISDNSVPFDMNKLKSLKFIFLEDLNLDTLYPIDQLKELEIINCWNNEIDSLVPIKNMVNLKKLYAEKNKINNLKPLRELVQLEILDLAENNISYTGDLYQLNNLINLDLSANSISDLRFFYNFNRLQFLNLSYNQVGDVTALKDCKHLEELYLYGNYSLNTESVVNIKKQLPNCKIHINYSPDGHSEEEFFGFIEIINGYVFFISVNESIEKQLYHVMVSLYETENNQSFDDFRNDMKKIAWKSVIEIVHSKGSAREKKRELFFEETNNVINVQFELT